MTAYTALFIASKNSEVEPLSASDVKNHFLKGHFSRADIVEREKQIRDALGYENEVSLHFDFVITLMKLWRHRVHDAVPRGQHMTATYRIICEVETAVYDFSKSVLADLECFRYRPSLIIAGLISATLEMCFKMRYEERQNMLARGSHQPQDQSLPSLDHLRISSESWDEIVTMLFGPNSVKQIDEFGRFIFLRQQQIYLGSGQASFQQIYKDRCRKFYWHSHVQVTGLPSPVQKRRSPRFKSRDFDPDEKLNARFADCLKWVTLLDNLASADELLSKASSKSQLSFNANQVIRASIS